MVYQAPLVAGAILTVQLWRAVAHWLETKKNPLKVPMCLHYYIIFYVYMMWLAVTAVMDFYQNILQETDWLDPDTVSDFVRNSMADEKNQTAVLEDWEKEADLSTFPMLKKFALTTPVWMFLTWFVCVWHTYDHVRTMRKHNKDLSQSNTHDCTITILGLPMVYGLMSFKSLMRMLQICINHVPNPHAGDPGAADAVMFRSTLERKNFLLEMYDTNFQVGDIYETIALVTFGNLVMDFLNKKLEIMRKAIDERFEARTARGEQTGESKSSEIDDVIKHLEGSMKNLTTFGVKLFAYTCAIQGGYNVIVTGFGFYVPDFHPEIFSRSVHDPGLLQTDAMKTHVHDFCFGMSMVSSCAAITNVMMIESDFHHLLQEFSPAMKFWGTKILVSLAAVQSCAEYIPPFATWFRSEVQWGVFYSSMLTLECLLIAVFHFFGWDAKENWYQDDEAKWQKEIEQPLLQKFKGGSSPATPA